MNNKQNIKAKQMQAYQQALKRSKPFVLPQVDKKIVVSIGYFSAASGRSNANFPANIWHEVRVDCDATLNADIVAEPFALSMIADNSVDGVFIGHVLQRFNFDEAAMILREALRILKDSGIIIATVPDMQLAATYLANDELEAAVYHAPVGGITAIDMMFGFQKAIKNGEKMRQHLSGFTANSLGMFVREVGFCNLKVIRQPNDLLVLGYKLPYNHPERVERIVLQTEPAQRPKAGGIAASNATQQAVRYADPLEGEPQRWKPLNLKKN
jgi:predicted SAM-dependent methyltransferase